MSAAHNTIDDDLARSIAIHVAAAKATQAAPGSKTSKGGKKTRVPASEKLKAWALHNRGKLTAVSLAASMGPAGDVLAAAPDGWKTALVLGAAGSAAAGTWGWLPGLIKWKGTWWPARQLPGITSRYVGLSLPVTGSALLTTMAATGGPEWGQNPWWGFSLAWSAGYGAWLWTRWGQRPGPQELPQPELTQQMLDWQEFAAGADGPYPKSKLVEPIALPKGGWSAEILVPRGRTFDMGGTKLTDTASALEVDDLDLITLEPLGPRRGRVSVFTENPLKKGTLFGPQHVVDPATGLAPFGVYYDGKPANYRFWLPGSGAVHDFITGTSGSGKSRAIDALLGIERRSPLMCSIVIDPQAGLSLPDWPDGVAVFAPGNALGIVVLRAVHAWMKERSNRYNRMKWTDDKGRTRVGRAFFVPGDPDPLAIVTLEEAHDMLNDPEHGPEAVKIVGDLAKEARKVGIKFRLANQSPNASELGGETLIRDILQGGNNMVLRSGSTATGKRAAGGSLGDVDPASIPKEFNDGTNTGGMGYFAGPDNRSALWRAPFVDDAFGLAHDGETTGIEQASIDAVPLLRHVLAEHALMLRLRNAGEQYTYDPERFTEGTLQAAPTPSLAKTPAAASSPATAPAPAAAPGLSHTVQKIVAFLKDRGRPTAPAVIARGLGMNGPQVRTALKRIKDDPNIPVTNVGYGAWVHNDHASDYQQAA